MQRHKEGHANAPLDVPLDDGEEDVEGEERKEDRSKELPIERINQFNSIVTKGAHQMPSMAMNMKLMNGYSLMLVQMTICTIHSNVMIALIIITIP